MLEGFRERKLDVTVALQELADIAGHLGARSLKERLDRELVKKLEEDRFHLVVVGEFNHGKSSFVNALLGENVLPVGVTPTTAAIHHLKHADTPETTIVYTSGKREPIPFADTRKVRGRWRRRTDSPDSIDYLEVGYPAALLKERILLVDTPGVNDLSLQRADITYSYIPRADAVLFLLDAGQILKESERQFLNDKLLKQSRDKIVFVITKWDILNEDEKKEALAYARAQLANLVKDPIVFPISAETALQGGDNAKDSGVPELLAHLTTFLAEERGRILLDNALGEGMNAVELLDKGIDARRRSLAMKTDELERRIKVLEDDLRGQAGTIEQRRMKIREEISGIKVGAQKDLERFVDETIRQLPNVIESAKKDDLRKFLPAFLEDTFRKWAESESKEIAHKLEALAETTIALIKEDAHDATKRVAATLGNDVQKLDIKIDRFRYDAGVVAVMMVGIGTMAFVNVMVGGLLTLAAPVLAMVVRDRVDAEYKKQAKDQAPEVIRSAARQVGPKLDEMIEEFARKLDTWVVTAGEELYREVLEVLNGSRDARAKGDQDATQALAEVDGQTARLAKARTRVEDLRASLAGAGQKLRVADSATQAGLPPPPQAGLPPPQTE